MNNEEMTDEAVRDAYAAQCKALRLKPWETPPYFADAMSPTKESDGKSYLLLQQMLKLGVSRWHHDPLAAIAEAERREKS